MVGSTCSHLLMDYSVRKYGLLSKYAEIRNAKFRDKQRANISVNRFKYLECTKLGQKGTKIWNSQFMEKGQSCTITEYDNDVELWDDKILDHSLEATFLEHFSVSFESAWFSTKDIICYTTFICSSFSLIRKGFGCFEPNSSSNI